MCHPKNLVVLAAELWVAGFDYIMSYSLNSLIAHIWDYIGEYFKGYDEEH